MIIVLLCGLALAACSDAAQPHVPPAAVTSSFDAPAELAGLPLVSDPDKYPQPLTWLKWLKGTIGAPTDALAVTYTDQNVRADALEIADVIEIAAVAGPVPEPAAAMVGMRQFARGFDDLAPVDPGPLGGAVHCGFSIGGITAITGCFWVDPGSIGMLSIASTTAKDRRADVAALRAQVQHSTGPQPALSIPAGTPPPNRYRLAAGLTVSTEDDRRLTITPPASWTCDNCAGDGRSSTGYLTTEQIPQLNELLLSSELGREDRAQQGQKTKSCPGRLLSTMTTLRGVVIMWSTCPGNGPPPHTAAVLRLLSSATPLKVHIPPAG